jgi:hypothetical protein
MFLIFSPLLLIECINVITNYSLYVRIYIYLYDFIFNTHKMNEQKFQLNSILNNEINRFSLHFNIWMHIYNIIAYKFKK